MRGTERVAVGGVRDEEPVRVVHRDRPEAPSRRQLPAPEHEPVAARPRQQGARGVRERSRVDRLGGRVRPDPEDRELRTQQVVRAVRAHTGVERQPTTVAERLPEHVHARGVRQLRRLRLDSLAERLEDVGRKALVARAETRPNADSLEPVQQRPVALRRRVRRQRPAQGVHQGQAIRRERVLAWLPRPVRAQRRRGRQPVEAHLGVRAALVGRRVGGERPPDHPNPAVLRANHGHTP